VNPGRIPQGYQPPDSLHREADRVAAACSFCGTMHEDGINALKGDRDIQVIGIAELPWEAVGAGSSRQAFQQGRFPLKKLAEQSRGNIVELVCSELDDALQELGRPSKEMFVQELVAGIAAYPIGVRSLPIAA